MPEPVLAFVSLGIAAIGLLVTLRNAIDIIIRDKDHIQGFIVTDLVLVRVEITLLENRLQLWRKLWSIYDGVPYHQFVTFWGNSGASQIHEVVGTAERVSQEIANEFQSVYGVKQADARNRLSVMGLLRKHETTSEQRRQKMMEKLMIEYNTEFRLAKRTKLSLFNSPTFQNHLKTLENSVVALENLSVSEFEKHHDFPYDERAAKELGLQAILLQLARESAESTTDLLEWCQKRRLPETMAIDFHLDLAYRSGMQSRNEYLTHRARQKGYPYYIRLANDTDEDGYLEVVLHSKVKISGLEQLVENLATEAPGSENISSIGSPENQNSSCRHNIGDRPTQISESLRNVLLSSPQKLEDSDYHQFSRPERYKLAYELSEMALVLLSSTSLCQMCVCAVRRLCFDPVEDEYGHLIRINNAHGLETGSPVAQDSDWWCKRELLNMHILRVGIVLVEVSTGAVVKYAKHDVRSNEVKITLGFDNQPADDLKDCSPSKIASIVKDAAGEDLSRAVYFCLRQYIRPENIKEKHLAAFYNRVVAP